VHTPHFTLANYLVAFGIMTYGGVIEEIRYNWDGL
jgi:hypothetical protein